MVCICMYICIYILIRTHHLLALDRVAVQVEFEVNHARLFELEHLKEKK